MSQSRESSARARVAMQPPRPGRIALALAVALLGFLLATQFKARESLAGRLSTEREVDLTRLLGELQEQSDQLNEERLALQIELTRAAGTQGQEAVLIENAARDLDSLRLLLGLVAATGQGIEIRIDDPESTVGPDLLVDAIQELRDAGAEALEVNGVRVIAQTAFSGDAGRIRIDKTALKRPYLIRAIGARQTLAEAMRIPGGVVDSVESMAGATLGISEKAKLVIASLRGAPRFSYATPG